MARLWLTHGGMVAIFIAGLIAVVFSILALSMPLHLAREREECDRQMAILMSTRDAVELQRAMFLVYQLDCRIGSRLPSPP